MPQRIAVQCIAIAAIHVITPVWLYNTSERKLSQIERPAYEQASAELTNLKQTNSNLR